MKENQSISGEVLGKKVDCLKRHVLWALSCWKMENSVEI